MTISRTEKRKLETREHIKEVAIELLKNMRSTELKMEQVADKADVSRKTVYNHFASKENLLCEIINPMLLFSIECVKAADGKDTIVIQDIAEVCVMIYKEYGDALSLMYNIGFEDLESSLALHKEYTQIFIGLFKRVEDLDYKYIEYRQAAFIVFKTFIAILNTLSGVEGYETLFAQSLHGLLKGLE